MKKFTQTLTKKYIHEFTIMLISTLYSKCLNEILQKQQKLLPSCISLNAEDIWVTISAAIFYVSWYRNIFCGYKLNSMSR